MKYIISLSVMLLISCTSGTKTNNNVIFVSIAPLANLVEQIAADGTPIEVLVPQTTSPETYEPTTIQIAQLSSARLYINIGLIDFETELNRTIKTLSDTLTVVDLSQGITPIDGEGSHEGHAHGVDPHTWLSPTLMRSFSVKIKEALDTAYPNNREIHEVKLQNLISKIDSLDTYIRASKLATFAIAHPSLSYYARDYNVTQVAIEFEGKEPTIAQLKSTIDALRAAQVTKVLYQKQTSTAAATTVAGEIRAQAIEFDPLARDWIQNLYFLTDHISDDKTH